MTVTLDFTRSVVVVRDTGAPPTAGSGCTAEADGAVRCAQKGMLTGSVVLGDGDDKLTITNADGTTSGLFSVDGGAGNDHLVHRGGSWLHGGEGDDILPEGDSVRGGDGDDTLTLGGSRGYAVGGPGNDRVTGGAGNDRIDGGPGADHLLAGPGDDEIRGGAGRDAIDGGAGLDGAEFEHDAGPVTVVLTTSGPGGPADEPDTLVAIESLGAAGIAADHLHGDDGPNKLSGAGGRNVIAGRGGDDDLEGAGLLDGGAGDDHLLSAGAAELRCGSGRDRVQAEAGDRVARDCERVGFENTTVEIGRLRVRGRAVRVQALCTIDDCVAKVLVRAPGGRVLARLRGRRTREGRFSTLRARVSRGAARVIRTRTIALVVWKSGAYGGPRTRFELAAP